MSKRIKRKNEFEVERYREIYVLVAIMGAAATVAYSCFLASAFGVNIFSLFGGFFK